MLPRTSTASFGNPSEKEEVKNDLAKIKTEEQEPILEEEKVLP